METVERRALVLAVAVVVLLGFDRPADFTTVRGTGWQVAIYVLGLLCLGAAAVLIALVFAPHHVVSLRAESRDRLTFFACAAVAGAVVAVVVLRVYASIYLHRHPGAGFGP